MVKQNQKIFNGLLLAIDWSCLLLALTAAYAVRFSFFAADPYHLRYPDYLRLLVFIVPVYTFFFCLFGGYRSKRSDRLPKELLILLETNSLGIISLFTFLYMANQTHYSRLCLLFFALFLPAIMGIQRVCLRSALRLLRKKGYNLKFILLVGSGGLAEDFVRRIGRNPNFGYRFTGCLSDTAQAGQVQGVPVIGDIPSLGSWLQKGGVDEVVGALELEEYPKMQQVMADCEKNGIKVHVIPAFFSCIPSNPQWEEVDGMPVMTLRRIPLANPLAAAAKRLFDIIAALAAIVAAAPVMGLVWLVIRLTMGSPAIFRQERLGMGCKPFTMYKFRSMRKDAPSDGWTARHDARRTRFGRLIRRLSIDELPQLFNVLKGEMSIVGPRPEIACYAEQFRESIPRYMVKHQVKPGMTGWAQIHGLRGDTSITERTRYDLYYIEHWSPALDLYILLKTAIRAFYNENE